MSVGQTKSNAEVDITTLAEYWSHPSTSQALVCGPLPVLETFRGKEPFSRRGWKRTGDCPRAGRQELLDRDFAAGFQFFVLSRKCLHEGMRDQQS